VVADLTRGSGHFAAAQGVVGTVHGIGGMTSMALAGVLVVWAGYNAAFLTLAAIAALGALLFWLFMPETRAESALATAGHGVAAPSARSLSGPKPHPSAAPGAETYGSFD
jgi:hypothetical protein